MSTARSENNSHETTKKTIFLTKRSSEGLKEFSLKKLLKHVEKSTKRRSKSRKNKVIWKLTKTPVKKKQKQLELNTELRTRKISKKRKKCLQSEHSRRNLKKHWKDWKIHFFKKSFRYLKEITNFLNEVLKSEANRQNWKNTNNSNNFKFWKLQKKFGNRRWKMKKNCQKPETNVEKWKTSNSDNRFWCWKKSLKVTSKNFWNAKYYALLRKTIKIKLKSKFLKKNSNEVEVSSNIRKGDSRVQDRSTKLKNELKNWKTKKLRKGVQTLVKLLISEKVEISKKISQVKKSSTSEKCFRSAKSAKLKKEQIKLKTNIEKLRRNLRTIVESFDKSLKGPKKCKFGKFGKT